MITKILNGRRASELILNKLEKKLSRRTAPLLVTIVVGRRPDSLLYVRLKEAAAARIGIRTESLRLPSSIAQKKLLLIIKKLNQRTAVTGILLQLPLPSHLETSVIIDALNPSKDIDGLHPKSPFVPPFIQAMFHLLRLSRVHPQRVCVLASPSPLRAKLVRMLGRSAQVEVDSAIKKIPRATNRAEAVFTFRGRGPRLKRNNVARGAVVIDGGIRRHEAMTVGDFDPSGVTQLTAYSPVPGGVGPLTIAYLLKNLIRPLR